MFNRIKAWFNRIKAWASAALGMFQPNVFNYPKSNPVLACQAKFQQVKYMKYVYPSKSQRSPELVQQLKDKAEVKRERKRGLRETNHHHACNWQPIDRTYYAMKAALPPIN